MGPLIAEFRQCPPKFFADNASARTYLLLNGDTTGEHQNFLGREEDLQITHIKE